jgi:hypothetical protein
MHRLTSSFVLGYHGCEEAVAEALLAGEPFKKSSNDYDWLGPGIYFWEANPQRGLDFAAEAFKRKRSARKPAVVGAVIDLGLCLDLASQGSIEMLEEAYKSLKATMDATGEALPENVSLLRKLDCAVVNRLHSILDTQGLALDSVRGIFLEGSPIYPDAGFHKKTHVQIAVCNPACIKGVFRVSGDQLQHWHA